MRLAAPWGCPVDASLAGHTILLVEDEPVIALDIVTAFQAAGATIAVAQSVAAARDVGGITTAVLDFGLRDGDTKKLCQRFAQKHVPFVLHSGYADTVVACDARQLPWFPSAPPPKNW